MAQQTKAPQILTETDIQALLKAASLTRYPVRNRAIVLLTCDAGLTPSEIAHLRRYNMLGEDGLLSDRIDLLNKPTKRLSPRIIPIGHKSRLWWAILDLLKNAPARPEAPLIISERALEGGGATKEPVGSALNPMRPDSICYVYYKLCAKANVDASARTGRHTFMTKVGRKLNELGGGARELQAMCGQRSLEDVQRFMEADAELQKRAIADLFEPLRR